MQLLDKHITVMRNHLLNAVNNLEKRCVFSAFQDVVKFIVVFERYLKTLKDIREGKYE